ncbi:uncharacterized protein LOC100186363 isoform X1 [Ciona intestinalis]
MTSHESENASVFLKPEMESQRRHSWDGRFSTNKIDLGGESTVCRNDSTGRRRRELRRSHVVTEAPDVTLFEEQDRNNASTNQTKDDPTPVASENKNTNNRPWGLRRRTTKTENHCEKIEDSTPANQTGTPKRRSGIASFATGSSPRNLWQTQKPSVRFTDVSDSNIEAATPPDMSSRSFRNRRATVHYSSTGRPSVMERRLLQPIAVFLGHPARIALEAKEGKALEQTKDICKDYIVHRLQQRKLANRVKVTRQQSASRALSRDVIFIASELERMQKHLYSDVSKQIGITLRSEDVLRKVFFELAGEILTTEPVTIPKEGAVNGETKKEKSRAFVSSGSRIIEITWGRICAVVAIAGGLSIDCVNQGHSDLVNQLIEFCGEFASEEGVLRWIVSQGGWETLREMTDDHSASHTANDYGYLTHICNVALALTACTLATVLSVVAIASVSDTAG